MLDTPAERPAARTGHSALAIETALTLRLIQHLPLRQAEGFLTSLFARVELDLPAAEYTTLS